MPGARGIPSVTEILSAAGLGWSGWQADLETRARALARGRAVHAAIALQYEGRLDSATLHPMLLPYYAAFTEFRAQHPAPAVWCERALVHRHETLMGHPDALLAGGVLVDWKVTEQVDEAAAALQLAGYEWLLEDAGHKVAELWAVGLRGNGSHRVHDLTALARRKRHVVEAATVVWHERAARRPPKETTDPWAR